jgi:beta-1,2-mannobiose phosphorylase / 1,2-beta-oligomannan phosphorylase
VTTNDVRHVRRLTDRPVVEAGSVPGYGAIFNAGLLYHEGKYHLFARGVRDGYRRNEGTGPRFLDYISDVLVLTSIDGHRYEFEYVLARAGTGDVHCYEDPRVQRVIAAGHEHIVMTYTSLPLENDRPWRIGAHRLTWEGGRFHLDEASGRLLGPSDIANKDAIVFSLSNHRVAMIHRIHPNMQLAVFDDLEHLWHAGPEYWDPYMSNLEAHTLMTPSPGALGIGAGAPPVPTDDGLLLFFHERRADGAYTANLALLDNETGRLLSRLDQPLLEPELHWEREGDVDNVVFVQGAHRHDDLVYLTYGAADRCVGVATAQVSGLVRALSRAA